MKQTYLFAFLVLFASCSSSYQFVQVQEYSADHGSLSVENNDVQITYSVKHLSDGWCEYSIYNKTDGFVYIDLSKTFTIDPQGYVHNVISSYEKVSLLEKSMTNQTIEELSDKQYIIFETADIVVIPPKALKKMYGLATGPGLMLHCDLKQFPSTLVSVDIDSIIFKAVTTYRTDDMHDERTIANTITLDKVSNMPEYIIARYKERPAVCENMRKTNEYYPAVNDPVYDLYYETAEGSLMFPYYTYNSSKKYYDYKPEYRWSSVDNGYKKIR